MFRLVDFGKIFLYELAILGSAWLAFNIDYKQIATNMDLRLIGMRTLYQYCKSRTQLQKYWSESYKNNCITKIVIDSLNYALRYVNSKWKKIRLEPLSTQWLSTCILRHDHEYLKVTVRDEGDHQIFFGCMFYETFHGNEDWSKGCSHETFVVENKLQPEFAKVSDIEILLLLKSDEHYLSRVAYISGKPTVSLSSSNVNKVEHCKGSDHETPSLYYNNLFKTTKNNDNDTIIISFVPSSVRFLSVEYRHPAMDRPISLEIDKMFYLEGNHLLSAAFVRRCLEYQCEPELYYFDMNYTLIVLDNEVNIIELKSHQYVVLEKDSYKII